jgi:hypothetical protein
MTNFKVKESVDLGGTTFASFDDLAKVVIEKYLDFKFIDINNLSEDQKNKYLNSDVENDLYNI